MTYFRKFALFLVIFSAIMLIIVNANTREQTLLFYSIGINAIIFLLTYIFGKNKRKY